jgi:hypothetical protein
MVTEPGKDGDYFLLSPGWHFAARYPKVAEVNDAHQKDQSAG